MSAVRVLLVDPNAESRDAIRRLLQGRGIEMSFALDGSSALTMLFASEVRVMVSGLDLQQREGVQLLLAAKSDHPSLRIVALAGTERADPGDCFSIARRFGADAAFTRPIPQAIFLETILELMREV